MAMDMSMNKKSFEMQAKVKQNAQELRQSFGSFSEWQKDIKCKEQKLIEQHVAQVKEEEELYTKVRSHVFAESHEKENKSADGQTQVKKSVSKDSLASSPSVEKREQPLDPDEEKRKRANAIKDSGNSLVKLEDYEGAILKYTEAIEVYPEDAVFYSNRALCYLRLEKYNECIEDCDQAIDIDKLLVKAYYRRMQANESLGNNMDALKDCTSALMIEPKNKDAQKSLDRINERLRRTVRKPNGPNFTELRENMLEILPFDKPPYKRSTKPLRRVVINEVILPKAESGNMKISDEDIDRLFNSNCGPFVEVKPSSSSSSSQKEDAAKRAKLDDTKKDAEHKVKQEMAEMKEFTKLPKDKNTLELLMRETEKVAVKQSHVVSVKEAHAETVSTEPPYEATWSEAPLEPLSFETMKSSQVEQVSQSKGVREQSKEIEQKIDTLPPVPKVAAEFNLHWNELSPPQKYQYFKLIPLKKLLHIVGFGLEWETFAQIIEILHDYYLPNKDPLTLKTLEILSKHANSDLLSMMLPSKQKNYIKEILDTFKDSDAKTVDVIVNNFDTL